MKTLIIALICFLQFATLAQNEENDKIRKQILSKTNVAELKNLSIEFANKYRINKEEAIRWAVSKGYPIRTVSSDGTVSELQGFLNGRPRYKSTRNRIAAQTTSTDNVWGLSGFNLDGAGIEIGLWDGGAVFVDHESFREGPFGQGHAFFIDPPGTEISDHSTHVAGTIIANDDHQFYAKGMADESLLFSRDYNDDLTEMTNAAAGIDPNLSVPLILSNHSYGEYAGWVWGDFKGLGTDAWYWWAEDYENEDPSFGDYNQVSYDYDQIAFNAPYYTIVWAAGNDRGEGPEPNAQHWVWDGENWVSSTSYHPKDGEVANGFKCLPPDGVAKNLITVGAVDDISYGYQSPADVQQENTDFSVWGPTKDGRIKPDIVANGDELYSTFPDNLYDNMSGTSMAAPNVTGSLALLLQHYKNTHNNYVPLSSTLKAIVIHTADESGSSDGPDYKYGWGLLNTYNAAQLIAEDQGNTTAIQKLTLQNGQSYTLDNLYSEGTQPIKISLVWNDIPPSNYQIGPILVHDLDVRLYKDGTPYYPWKLNPGNPNSPATKGDNSKDNVEQILLQTPSAGYYSVVVSHKGNLSFDQMFSLVVTGFVSPFVTFNLKQIGFDSQPFGQAAYWENSIWNYVPPTQPITLPLGDNHFLSTQDFRPSTYEKFNKWNDNLPETDDWYRNWDIIFLASNTSTVKSIFSPSTNGAIRIKNSLESTDLSTGIVEFKDPWLVDFDEPPYGIRSRGMDAPFKQRSSPFRPDFWTNYNGDVYKGVFKNQSGPGSNWEPPYYSVGMPTEQTISIHSQSRKFFPYKWTGGDVHFRNIYSRQTGVVFTANTSVATAVLKGQLMSNDQNGISSNSQRKIVRTDNSRYHVVYESMGTVWYAQSVSGDFYGDWYPDQLMLYNGKNPAIEYEGNIVKVVCEEYDPQVGGDANLWLLTFTLEASGWYENTEAAVFATYPNSYYGSAKPAISFNNGQIFIAYRTSSNGAMKQRTKWYNSIGQYWFWGNEEDIPETSGDAINPAVIGSFGNIHIAFESFGSIKYKFGYIQGYSWLYNDVVYLSAGSGFNNNKYPAISLSDGLNSYVMVSWLGIYSSEQYKISLKEQGGSEPQYREAAVVKVGWGTSWGTFSNFGDNVDFTNNGSLNTLYGSIMAWSESDGDYSKFVRRRNPFGYDAITALSSNGIQTMVSNGSELWNIKAMVFNTATNAPYLLNRCTNDFTYIPDFGKISETEVVDISYGRTGVVGKNGLEFVFNIGDVLLDGNSIKFIERVDTLPITSIEELNASVRTDTLSLNSQSELIFSDYYYVVNAENADSLLSNEFNVSFNCELVKVSNGEVIGVFEQVNYNKNNLEEYGFQGYLINCSGIETGDYYLRLITNVNEEVDLSLSDIQLDDVLLEKLNLQVRNFNGENIPLEYSLEQNFPNPFNPSTTIKYQLPEAGNVTIKLYDILGSEVATLVDDFQNEGRYEVNFNASSLASGVYLYRLQVNDFVNTKKMILLK